MTESRHQLEEYHGRSKISGAESLHTHASTASSAGGDPMSLPPAVLIVEDDPEQAHNLEDLFSMYGLSTACYGSVEALLAHLPQDASGCLVLDIRLGNRSGLEVLERLRQEGRWLPAVVVSGQATVAEAVRAFELGVYRFFQKPVEPPALVHAVLDALAELKHQRTAQNCQEPLKLLSPREREVLHELMADKPVRQIARELGISVSTVEKHRAKILAKVGVDSLVGLARLYFGAAGGSPPSPHLSFGGDGVEAQLTERPVTKSVEP
jgi:FixJ family two-component response regulator